MIFLPHHAETAAILIRADLRARLSGRKVYRLWAGVQVPVQPAVFWDRWRSSIEPLIEQFVVESTTAAGGGQVGTAGCIMVRRQMLACGCQRLLRPILRTLSAEQAQGPPGLLRLLLSPAARLSTRAWCALPCWPAFYEDLRDPDYVSAFCGLPPALQYQHHAQVALGPPDAAAGT
jgi:hypothetical protein